MMREVCIKCKNAERMKEIYEELRKRGIKR